MVGKHVVMCVYVLPLSLTILTVVYHNSSLSVYASVDPLLLVMSVISLVFYQLVMC